MKRTMNRNMESLGQVFSEGVLVDEEQTVSLSRTSHEAPRSPAWAVRPHVRPTGVGLPGAPTTSTTDPFVAVKRRILNMEAMEKPVARTAFSSAIRQSICSHVDLFYYSDLYMSQCVKDMQDIYQAFDKSPAPSVSDVPSHETSTWWRHLVAGGVAGAVSRTSTAPLDRLKVFLMVYSSGTNDLRMSSAFRTMIREGGICSLWRGNGMNVAKVMPEMALKFMAYDQIKSYIKGSTNKELNIGERFAAGSLAGVLSQSAIYPLEVIKTRLVIRKTGQYSGICDCAKNILKIQGFRGFYRGYLPNILGIIPYAGIDLAVYETLKRSYMNQQSSTNNPNAEVLVSCAIVSSTCGQLVSYPLSLVRTRLQAHAVSVEGIAESASGIVRTIAKTDGARGFYRGLLANLMKVAPAVSISYVVYEKTRLAFGADMS